MKQSKLRKRRVWRYAALYLAMLVLFVGLIVGPIVATKNISDFANAQFGKSLGPDAQQPLTNILQPVGQDNNDTFGAAHTGTKVPDYPSGTGTAAVSVGAVTSAPTSDAGESAPTSS